MSGGAWKTPDHSMVFELTRPFPEEEGLDLERMDVLLLRPTHGDLILLQNRNGKLRRRILAQRDFVAAARLLSRVSGGVFLRDFFVYSEEGEEVPLDEPPLVEDKGPAVRPSPVSRPIAARSRAEAIRELLKDTAGQSRGSR